MRRSFPAPCTADRWEGDDVLMPKNFHPVSCHVSLPLYDALVKEAAEANVSLAMLVRLKLGDVLPTQKRKPQQPQRRRALADDIDITGLTDADLDALMG